MAAQVSNIQIDLNEAETLQLEREKLRKLSSITIIDYIREQIQILMQMKCEEDKEPSHRNKEKHKFAQGENGAASEFASSF